LFLLDFLHQGFEFVLRFNGAHHMQQTGLILFGKVVEMHDFLRQLAGRLMEWPPRRILKQQMVNADIKGLCQFYHHLNRWRHFVILIAAYLSAVNLSVKGKLVLAPALFLP